MNDLISRAEAIELKPEFLNPNVNRETKEQTAIDRAYARGWNSCNTHWIKEIIEDLPSAQPEIVRCKDCKLFGNSEQLPSAQPERKNGKWITQEFGSWAECSECHELYDIPIAYSNFCPHCGADMREAERREG